MAESEMVYRFRVSLKVPKMKVYREMALKGSSSLYKFAEVIIGSFDFYFDHCFGFYNKSINRSTEAYTLFYDNGEEVEPYERSVKNTNICNVFQSGKKMHFHFDYGDDWKFLVDCRTTFEAEKGVIYPVVTKKVGEAPPQYPDISDDEQ